MAHAETCPVCGGSGEVWRNDPHTSSVGYYTVCHGCGGCGWVVVDGEGGVTVLPCDNCPWKPQEPYYPYQPWTPWNPHEHEWWYTSGKVTIRMKIVDNPEIPVDCGGNHQF